MKSKRHSTAPGPTSTCSFETFRKIDSYYQDRLTDKEPSCFNGEVCIVKYRITVTKVDEPKEVLEARLRKLWSECDNHHHWQPLEVAAKAIGITLKHEDCGKNKTKTP